MTLAPPTEAPALYAQDGAGYAATVHARYYVPGHAATWFVTEYDPETGYMFGWAELIPGCGELGYTNFEELQATGLVVRDTDWTPVSLNDAVDNRENELAQYRYELGRKV